MDHARTLDCAHLNSARYANAMNTLLDEIWKIILGLFGLACIFIAFIVLFKVAAWIDLRLAYGLGLVFWVSVAVMFANEWGRS